MSANIVLTGADNAPGVNAHKWKHDLQRLWREADERRMNAIEQGVYREGWQDERKALLAEIARLRLRVNLTDFGEDLEEARKHLWELEKDLLLNQLAEKEAEIVRLTLLLEEQSKRKR